MFLGFVLLLLIWQGYSGYQQFKHFHQELSERSVTSTVREITSLVKSRKKTVRLFTEQENEALIKLLDPSLSETEQFNIEKTE